MLRRTCLHGVVFVCAWFTAAHPRHFFQKSAWAPCKSHVFILYRRHRDHNCASYSRLHFSLFSTGRLLCIHAQVFFNTAHSDEVTSCRPFRIPRRICTLHPARRNTHAHTSHSLRASVHGAVVVVAEGCYLRDSTTPAAGAPDGSARWSRSDSARLHATPPSRLLDTSAQAPRT